MQGHTPDDTNGSNTGLAILPPVVEMLDGWAVEQKHAKLEW